MLHKINRIAIKQAKALDKIVQEITHIRKNAEPKIETPDPVQTFNEPLRMPPLDDENISIASTGSFTTQIPDSPMSALQGYNTDENPAADFGLTVLKQEYGLYPNID